MIQNAKMLKCDVQNDTYGVLFCKKCIILRHFAGISELRLNDELLTHVSNFSDGLHLCRVVRCTI